VNCGSSITFTATPNNCQEVEQWKVNGIVVQTGDNSYTISDVQANAAIEVTFKTRTYTVTPWADAGGSISPNVLQTVNCGGSITFTATPNDCQEIVHWILNGTVIPTNDNSFTISDVQVNTMIQVIFRTITYTITPSAGSGGTISPNVPLTIDCGGYTEAFTFEPVERYYIDQVLIDGENDPAAVASGTYTFVNVTANHTIHVIFAAIPQTIPLNTGWNWVSTNMLNTNPSILEQMKTSLGVIGEQIKSKSAFIQYYNPVWVGTLISISEKEMYLIKVKAGHSMVITGEPADPATTPISVIINWNWIGYVPSFPSTTSYALSDVNAQTGDMIKNNTGFAAFYGTEWYGTLTSMQPGCGYLYYSTGAAPKTFYYPSVAAKSSIVEYQPLFELRKAPQKGLYADNMTVTAIVVKNDKDMFGDGIEIEAFCGNECRGSALMRYEADFDRYLCYLMIHGESNEMITLKVYDHATGKEYVALNTPFPFVSNEIKGNLFNPYVVNLESDITIGIGDGMEGKISIYPNPARDELRIETSDMRYEICDITIFDIYGREVQVSNLKSQISNHQPEIVLNVSHLASGVYFLRITSNEKTVTAKFVKN
jgi:hypothetical protein